MFDRAKEWFKANHKKVYLFVFTHFVAFIIGVAL